MTLYIANSISRLLNNRCYVLHFNPRSHWGATDGYLDIGDVARVSIHAPTWGATERLSHRHSLTLVSIHAPTWGATHIRTRQAPIRVVSIHAPTWGATGVRGLTRLQIEFQSTLPHGERRLDMTKDVWRLVSIHAPTWGATNKRDEYIKIEKVSIHAPTWGATTIDDVLARGEPCFNPRSHMGSDRRLERCC